MSFACRELRARYPACVLVRDGVSLLELHDDSALVVWRDGESGVRAIDFLLRFIAGASGVAFPPELTLHVAEWSYVPIDYPPLHARGIEEFIDRCVPEIQAWRYNPFLVEVAGSDRTWFLVTSDRDGMEIGPVTPMPDFAQRVLAVVSDAR